MFAIQLALAQGPDFHRPAVRQPVGLLDAGTRGVIHAGDVDQARVSRQEQKRNRPENPGSRAGPGGALAPARRPPASWIMFDSKFFAAPGGRGACQATIGHDVGTGAKCNLMRLPRRRSFATSAARSAATCATPSGLGDRVIGVGRLLALWSEFAVRLDAPAHPIDQSVEPEAPERRHDAVAVARSVRRDRVDRWG
jgi:hypothetical protein